MREILLGVCGGSEEVNSFYRHVMTIIGKVGNTLQLSLGTNPSHPSKPCIHWCHGRFGRTMGWADLAQTRQVASSIASLRRLVNFCPIHCVNSEFLAHSYISLILDIVRLIYCLIRCRFSSTLWLFSAKG